MDAIQEAPRPILHHGADIGETDGQRGPYVEGGSIYDLSEQMVALTAFSTLGYQYRRGIRGPVVVAYDSRPSGPSLGNAFMSGLRAYDPEVQIINAGVVPTPAAQKIGELLTSAELSSVPASLTGVISASHNEETDNAVKYMFGGAKPLKPEIRDVSNIYWEHADSGLVLPIHLANTAPEPVNPELATLYADTLVADIQKTFGKEQPLKDKVLVIDGAYGAAQKIAPDIYRRLGATVHEFACDGSGAINDGCGATDLEGVKRFLAEHPEIVNDPNFIGALAFDGDADRVKAVGVREIDGQRELVEIDGNHFAWLYGQDQDGIVATSYYNRGLDNVSPCKIHVCENGDVNVTAMLRDKKLKKGGEFTGHHVNLDWLGSGDGIHAGAMAAATLALGGLHYTSGEEVKKVKTFGDVYNAVPLWGEVNIPVKFIQGNHRSILEQPSVRGAIAWAQKELGDAGFVLVRPSGTEPKVRIHVQAKQGEKKASYYASILSSVVSLHAKA